MHEFVPIFDGLSLAGWHPAPRIYGTVYPGGPSVLEHFDQLGLARPVEPEKHPAHWFVEDGVLVGEQDTPGSGYGGYLVSDQAFGDFELVLEMRPDWPADTGVMIRRRRDSWEGFPGARGPPPVRRHRRLLRQRPGKLFGRSVRHRCGVRRRRPADRARRR